MQHRDVLQPPPPSPDPPLITPTYSGFWPSFPFKPNEVLRLAHLLFRIVIQTAHNTYRVTKTKTKDSLERLEDNMYKFYAILDKIHMDPYVVWNDWRFRYGNLDFLFQNLIDSNGGLDNGSDLDILNIKQREIDRLLLEVLQFELQMFLDVAKLMEEWCIRRTITLGVRFYNWEEGRVDQEKQRFAEEREKRGIPNEVPTTGGVQELEELILKVYECRIKVLGKTVDELRAGKLLRL